MIRSMQRFLSVCLLGVTIELVTSLPLVIVTSGKPFCRTIEAAKDIEIRVNYEAPDLVLEGEKEKSGPTYITVTEKPSLSALDVIEEQEGNTNKQHRAAVPVPVSPLSHEVLVHEGHVDYHVRNDAEVNICIRASSAGSKNPMRFGIQVDELEDVEETESGLPPTETVDRHLSFMEEQFVRIESQMHAVLREADFAKERDSIYHAKTDAMHKATIFWPIVHVGILLLTGFTQANHIVQFFKKRRII